MFSHIKTSKVNKEIVTELTNKLSLGTENIISRIALAYSLSLSEKLDINDIEDSNGKEYSSKVLFGDYAEYYGGMLAMNYKVHISDKDLSKYAKMHIDHGLQLLNQEINEQGNIDGFDFLIEKIENSLSLLP
jgi:DNA sulfur modification protein DndE